MEVTTGWRVAACLEAFRPGVHVLHALRPIFYQNDTYDFYEKALASWEPLDSQHGTSVHMNSSS